jgi:serine/threonine-protein kinase
VRGPGPEDSGARDARLANLKEAPDPYIGTILGERYKVLSKLGAGGMGAVYLAEHVVIERKVAIKILSQDFAHKADLVQRFIQEARAAARIGHENIVEVYDFGETASGSVFFAMEFLDGFDLAQLIQKNGQLPSARVRPIALQICRALAAAHSKKIVHRDLKPENIYLIEREGRTDFVKILDFGIAKISTVEEGGGRLTRTGMIFGTPEYMSPEQARGETPDHRVDIYALGCILYEMLTGKVPFQSETFMGTLTKHMFEPPELPSRRCRGYLAPDLEAVCLRAMEKDRDRRFQSMVEVAQALESGDTVLPPAQMAPMSDNQSMPGSPMQPGGLLPNMSLAPGMPNYQQQQQQQLQAQIQQQIQQQMQMMMQPGMYGVPQGPMQTSNSGVVQAPLSVSNSGLVQSPMQGGTMSGLRSGAMMTSGLGLPGTFSSTAPPAYEVARPSTSSMGRRLMFIFAGATIGVVILVLLLWPSTQDPKRNPARTATPGPTEPKPPKPVAPSAAKAGPARLMIHGIPESRVMLDFKDIGTIPASGELAYDADSPGTSEWSVHLKVVKEEYADFATRLLLKTGDTYPVQAEQPSQPSTPDQPKVPGPKGPPPAKKHAGPPPKPAAAPAKPAPPPPAPAAAPAKPKPAATGLKSPF